MFVDRSVVADNTVIINYDGADATVVISGNLADYVTASVEGAHVSIAQSDAV